MSVTWTETDVGQLQSIQEYLARSSPAYAQILITRIIARTEMLETSPHFGAQVEEYGSAEIRELFEHPYRIIYRVSGEDVQVVTLVHVSRQLPRNPPT